MDIFFRTTSLRKICSSERELRRHYGQQADKIMTRFRELTAAKCLDDIPTGAPTRRHKYKNNLRDYFAVDIKQPYRIIFKVANKPVPPRSDGGIDLTQVTEIEIDSIEYDPH